MIMQQKIDKMYDDHREVLKIKFNINGLETIDKNDPLYEQYMNHQKKLLKIMKTENALYTKDTDNLVRLCKIRKHLW